MDSSISIGVDERKSNFVEYYSKTSFPGSYAGFLYGSKYKITDTPQKKCSKFNI